MIELFFRDPPFSLSTMQIGLVMALVSLSLVLSAAVSGAVVNRCGPYATVAVAALLMLAGSLFFGPSPIFGRALGTARQTILAVNLAGIAVFGLGAGTFLPLASCLLLEACAAHGYAKNEVSEATSALLSIANQLGFIVGPAVGQPLYNAIGLPWMQTAFGALALAIPFYVLPAFVPCRELCFLSPRRFLALRGAPEGV